MTYITYCYITICCCLLHRESDITSSLTGISPVLAGQIKKLILIGVSIYSGCFKVLIQSLTPPHSRLLELQLSCCTISSSDYCHLIKALPTSNLTHFTSELVDTCTDVSLAMGLPRAQTQSKTWRRLRCGQSRAYQEED